MSAEFSYIIIDDSELDCFVTRKTLEHINKSSTILTFDNAGHALRIIREVPAVPRSPTIILLDLNMPSMNGYDFVEEFEKFPDEIQKHYSIAVLTILSKAHHPSDISRILTYKSVSQIIEKPLTREKLLSLSASPHFNYFLL